MTDPQDPDWVRIIADEVVARLMGQTDGAGSRMLPVAISARHVHLSPAEVTTLFGRGYELQRRKWLSQPGQFAAEETVAVVGPRGRFDTVRILGPARGASQVEISATDARALGLTVPVRLSGDHRATPGVRLLGPRGEVILSAGLIVAARHIHMAPADAARFGVSPGQEVRVRTSGERRLVFDRVLVRVDGSFRLEMHIDTDEGNAAGIQDGDLVELVE